MKLLLLIDYYHSNLSIKVNRITHITPGFNHFDQKFQKNTMWGEPESCYNDAFPAEGGNFLKLIDKYGYCQKDWYDLESVESLYPCYDLYIIMCFAAAQVAIGSVQILASIIGRVKGGNKVGDSEIDNSGPDFSIASDIGQSIIGIFR